MIFESPTFNSIAVFIGTSVMIIGAVLTVVVVCSVVHQQYSTWRENRAEYKRYLQRCEHQAKRWHLAIPSEPYVPKLSTTGQARVKQYLSDLKREARDPWNW